MPNIIQFENVAKEYDRGCETVKAVQNVTIAIEQGEFVGIVGPSGAGKSTMLHLMGALDYPTQGTIDILGERVSSLSNDALAVFRNRHIGFVFQQFFLQPMLTSIENVLVPTVFEKTKDRGRLARAKELLVRFGLEQRINHYPKQLSGGEMQRVALARALILNPSVILADEPTGNLDSHNATRIMDQFKQLTNDGLTVVFVTHNLQLTKQCTRIVEMCDGVLSSSQPLP